MAVNSVEAALEFEHDALLGEGPVWDEVEKKLYWLDIMNGNLYRYDPHKKQQETFEVGEHIGAVALRRQGGLVTAMKSGFAFFDPEQSEITNISDPEPHLPGNRFNDGKCDPSGRFWAGTMSYEVDSGAGSLYCLNGNLSFDKKLPDLTIPNGLAWSADRTRFFFIDSIPRHVYSFDYDDTTAEITNRQILRTFTEDEGLPDGMTIDEKDGLWVALYNGGKVLRLDPSTGETTFEVNLPVPIVTSCTFGGDQLDELYITTAREHMTDQQIQRWPLSGSLFKAKVPFKGLPAVRFSG